MCGCAHKDMSEEVRRALVVVSSLLLANGTQTQLLELITNHLYHLNPFASLVLCSLPNTCVQILLSM